MILRGLRDIAASYDAFLVDLWGVVHDGKAPFAGVMEVLRELASAGRRVVFLTNTSRASERVAETLEEMGIGRDLFEAVISSGDVTRAALLAEDPPLFAGLPAAPRLLHLGDASFVPWLFELGHRFVEDVGDADLVIATGAPRDEAALAITRAQLEPAAARDVPLVCTNPDRVIPAARGLTLGPGAVAALYAELGGRTFLYGKPHAPIYAAARRQLGEVPAARVLAIGDLLATDIRGARAAGMPSALVLATGGHAAALGPTPSDAVIDALCTEAGVIPDFVLDRFAW